MSNPSIKDDQETAMENWYHDLSAEEQEKLGLMALGTGAVFDAFWEWLKVYYKEEILPEIEDSDLKSNTTKQRRCEACMDKNKIGHTCC